MVVLGDLAALRGDVGTLDSTLLNAVIHQAPDPLAPNEEVLIRAYLLLAHAAIEEFVELAFSEYLADALVPDASGRVSPGLYLTLLQLSDDVSGALSTRASRTPQAILSMLPGLYKSKVVDPNHGIKADHVRKLAVGAGLDWNLVEAACPKLIPAMTTLGARRGEVAHVSSVRPTRPAGVQQTNYPADARKLASDVLDHLPELISHLSASVLAGQVSAGRRRRFRWFL